MPVFRTAVLALILKFGFGECSMGRTAGSGIEGAGEADRRIAGDDPKDDRRLWEVGGFMGFRDDGVPGVEVIGIGEPGMFDNSDAAWGLRPVSGGAGLLEASRRLGSSIFVTLLCWYKENWPSLVFNL